MKSFTILIFMCVSSAVSRQDNNSTVVKQPDQNSLSPSTLEALRILLSCTNKQNRPRAYEYGQYQVLRNYLAAEHGDIQCYGTVTYATHATLNFVDNVLPVVDRTNLEKLGEAKLYVYRWRAPISVTVFTPGTDLLPAIKSIRYLRDCSGSNLVRLYVSFHIFFPFKHMPRKVPDPTTFRPIDCNIKPPYMSIKPTEIYVKKNKMDYPINVARNIARDAALTHFILSSDIEMYPTRNLVPRFLNMIARNKPPLNNRTRPRVFPLRYFEVDAQIPVPTNKKQLNEFINMKLANPFHQNVCSICHSTLHEQEWLDAPESGRIEVFHVVKRQFKFAYWEPFYIGTNREPYYDERLSWEGMRDKMLQTFILCLLDYDFMILTDVFLCHKPGIKRLPFEIKREPIIKQQEAYIYKIIIPELLKEYPNRAECHL